MKSSAPATLFLAILAATFLGAAPRTPATTTPSVPSATQPAPVTPTAKIDLFNGKDVEGLVPVLKNKKANPAEVFSVKDGQLIIGPQSDGYLRTPTAYQNYKLTCEFKFIDLGKWGNTGVLVHINGTDKVWPTCIECQTRHDHIGEFWIWGQAKVDKKLEQRNGVLFKGDAKEKPVGEWNTYEVVCKGSQVTVSNNGTELNTVTSENLSAGYVALQAEGCTVAVRKWTLEPLP